MSDRKKEAEKIICFEPEAAVHYNLCGKFESPSPEWMHLTRNLIDFELMAVTCGTLYIADSKREYVVSKGEYLLMSPDKFQHGYKQCDCMFYWLHFSVPENTFQIQNEADFSFDNSRIYIPSTGRLSFMERMIVLMKQLQDSNKRYHNSLLNNSLTSAVVYELYCQGKVYTKYNNQNKPMQIYNDIIDYISYHACENIRVSEIADYFGYNEKYLSTLFKAQSGISLKQFMLRAKMDVAKAELTDSNHSIAQIAYNVGFNDTHNFTNSFKKITGLSPSIYRESYAKRALFHE